LAGADAAPQRLLAWGVSGCGDAAWATDVRLVAGDRQQGPVGRNPLRHLRGCHLPSERVLWRRQRTRARRRQAAGERGRSAGARRAGTGRLRRRARSLIRRGPGGLCCGRRRACAARRGQATPAAAAGPGGAECPGGSQPGAAARERASAHPARAAFVWRGQGSARGAPWHVSPCHQVPAALPRSSCAARSAVPALVRLEAPELAHGPGLLCRRRKAVCMQAPRTAV